MALAFFVAKLSFCLVFINLFIVDANCTEANCGNDVDVLFAAALEQCDSAVAVELKENLKSAGEHEAKENDALDENVVQDERHKMASQDDALDENIVQNVQRKILGSQDVGRKLGQPDSGISAFMAPPPGFTIKNGKILDNTGTECATIEQVGTTTIRCTCKMKRHGTSKWPCSLWITPPRGALYQEVAINACMHWMWEL